MRLLFGTQILQLGRDGTLSQVGARVQRQQLRHFLGSGVGDPGS